MNYQDKTIVVTGGSGMIGTHMIKEFAKRGQRCQNPYS